MYDSLKDWVNVSVTVKPFVKNSGTGDKIFGEPYTQLVLPVSELKVVRNKLGVEVTSNTQLYIDGKSTITHNDDLIFENETRPIQAVQTFYLNGVPDLKVVFL